MYQVDADEIYKPKTRYLLKLHFFTNSLIQESDFILSIEQMAPHSASSEEDLQNRQPKTTVAPGRRRRDLKVFVLNYFFFISLYKIEII